MKKVLTVICIMMLLSAYNAGAEGAAESHAHKHHIGVFFGTTHDSHGEDAFTTGLDYSYLLTDRLSVGLLVDRAMGDIDATVAGLAVFLHPWRGLRMLAAAANEHSHGHDAYVTRLGVGYDVHAAGLTVSPLIQADLLEHGEENWIYGVSVGMGF
jgi:hypothetical protein